MPSDDTRSVRLRAGVSVACLSLALFATSASAYRPFEGTDADVVRRQSVEIELQPAGMLREGSQSTFIAPAAVLNIGLVQGWEAVFEGRGQFPLSSSDEGVGPSLVGVGAFLKGVSRPGSLQDQPGPSIATEFGVLLPGINAESGFGASIAGIVSQQWDWGRCISTPPRPSRESIAPMCLSAPSSKVRTSGPSDRSPKSFTRRSSDYPGPCQASWGRNGRSRTISASISAFGTPSRMDTRSMS